jgi:hypothetical protein
MDQPSIRGETDDVGLAVSTMKTPAMSKDIVLGYAFRVPAIAAGRQPKEQHRKGEKREPL